MRNIFAKFSTFLFVISVLIAPFQAQAAAPLASTRDYDYQVVEQSPYPIMQPGEETILWVKLKNTGRRSWSRDTVRLGGVNPNNNPYLFDAVSGFEPKPLKANWVSDNRIKMDQATVLPGQVADFGFYIQANYFNSGTWKLYFRPVVDGVGWMKDAGIYWDVTINADDSFGSDEEREIRELVKKVSSHIVLPNEEPSVATVLKPEELADQPFFEGAQVGDKVLIFVNAKRAILYRPSTDIVIREMPLSVGTEETTDSTPLCAQVITRAKNPATGEVRDFPTPCAVPSNWTTVDNSTPLSPAKTYNTSGTYRYEFVSQSAHPAMLIGDKQKLTITIKNTGTATWYNDGPNPVRLATNRDRDRWSAFHDNSWIAENRPATLAQAVVRPGETGTFEFMAYASLMNSAEYIAKEGYRCYGVAPDNLPTPTETEQINNLIDQQLSLTGNCGYVDSPVREYFRPVVEGREWMRDIGIYWDITVRNDIIDAISKLQIEDFISESTVEKLISDIETENYDALISFALENIDIRAKTDISDVINSVANCSAITKTIPTQTAIGIFGISMHGSTTLSMSDTLYSTNPDSCVIKIKNSAVGTISLDAKARAILSSKGLTADRIQVLEREINASSMESQQMNETDDISITCTIKKNDLTTILKDVNGQRLSVMERLSFAKNMIFGNPPIANCQPDIPPDLMTQITPAANIMSARISSLLK